MPENLLRLPRVKARSGLSRSQIYALGARGLFPKPIKAGRASLWIKSEIDSWIAQRVAESRATGQEG